MPYLPLVVFPDAEALVIDYLDSSISGVTVVAAIPDSAEFTAALPIVQVVRVGGVPMIRKRLDNPILDIDVYAASREEAHDTLALIRAHMDALRGETHSDAVITSVREEAGPSTRPETNPAITRMGFTVGLFLRPA